MSDAEKATIGSELAAEPLLVIAWLRYRSARDLGRAARALEALSGRDPATVAEPQPERRYLCVAWGLEELREAAADYARGARRATEVLEREGGAWALAYGLGAAQAGAVCSHINRELADDPGFARGEVAALRIQDAQARFPATTQWYSDAARAVPPEAYGDGTPFPSERPREPDPDNDCGASG